MFKYLSSFLLGIVAVLMLSPLVSNLLIVNPYTNVRIIKEVWGSDSVLIQGTFSKNGSCRLNRFVVIGEVDDIPRYLTYTDLDGLPKSYDREEGSQGLNIVIHTEGDTFSKIEIRTGHICFEGTSSEVNVQGVFYEAVRK